MRWRVRVAIALAGLLLGEPAARACSLDDVDGELSRDTLNHFFPDSLDVLARVVEARRQAKLQPSPGLTPTPLHIRSLMGLTARLDRQLRTAAGDKGSPPVALLLVESMLWARLPALPSTAAPQLHADGPADGDLVVVTSEDAVRQIVAGKQSLAETKAQGLLRLYGAEHAAQGFLAAVGEAGRSVVHR